MVNFAQFLGVFTDEILTFGKVIIWTQYRRKISSGIELLKPRIIISHCVPLTISCNLAHDNSHGSFNRSSTIAMLYGVASVAKKTVSVKLERLKIVRLIPLKLLTLTR